MLFLSFPTAATNVTSKLLNYCHVNIFACHFFQKTLVPAHVNRMSDSPPHQSLAEPSEEQASALDPNVHDEQDDDAHTLALAKFYNVEAGLPRTGIVPIALIHKFNRSNPLTDYLVPRQNGRGEISYEPAQILKTGIIVDRDGPVGEEFEQQRDDDNDSGDDQRECHDREQKECESEREICDEPPRRKMKKQSKKVPQPKKISSEDMAILEYQAREMPGIHLNADEDDETRQMKIRLVTSESARIELEAKVNQLSQNKRIQDEVIERLALRVEQLEESTRGAHHQGACRSLTMELYYRQIDLKIIKEKRPLMRRKFKDIVGSAINSGFQTMENRIENDEVGSVQSETSVLEVLPENATDEELNNDLQAAPPSRISNSSPCSPEAHDSVRGNNLSLWDQRPPYALSPYRMTVPSPSGSTASYSRSVFHRNKSASNESRSTNQRHVAPNTSHSSTQSHRSRDPSQYRTPPRQSQPRRISPALERVQSQRRHDDIDSFRYEQRGNNSQRKRYYASRTHDESHTPRYPSSSTHASRQHPRPVEYQRSQAEPLRGAGEYDDRERCSTSTSIYSSGTLASSGVRRCTDRIPLIRSEKSSTITSQSIQHTASSDRTSHFSDAVNSSDIFKSTPSSTFKLTSKSFQRPSKRSVQRSSSNRHGNLRQGKIPASFERAQSSPGSSKNAKLSIESETVTLHRRKDRLISKGTLPSTSKRSAGHSDSDALSPVFCRKRNNQRIVSSPELSPMKQPAGKADPSRENRQSPRENVESPSLLNPIRRRRAGGLLDNESKKSFD
ncbi:hypothetical protein QAD02_013254 [Eretmocerus hayati]|uniref:Uncharacterized protein n=1 Tax=Eretmocerus hayati TaxID=131215 RepID=A0ACC2P252_9HYME|nr:hypothetical protein QAD02_013254 [Eretmocerus hayati]